jgi:Damage-control phosphatase ARMT1-like domain
MSLPPEFMNDDPAGFAWGVWHDRTPKLLAGLRQSHPFGPGQLQALGELEEAIATGVIRPLAPDARGAAAWRSWSAGYLGKPWAQTPFLWSESYFFRRLLEATGFFTAGPWYHFDPFAYLKTGELHDQGAEDALHAVAGLGTYALVLASLWGNRADLGFRIGGTAEPEQAGLVADDSRQLLDVLDQAKQVDIVADNAGHELLTDLALIDHLLAGNPARGVRLHVKPYPYYVSDATAADAVACLQRLGRTAATAAAAARLRDAAATGRFTLHTDEFYCAPLDYRQMPGSVAAQFARASVTIMKGDLNYRRLVGDRAWPPGIPFQRVTSYFPSPVAALRTLKSDVITGISEDVLAGLGQDGAWRTDGSRGQVQFRP